MTSKREPDLLDLERDLPTTPGDVAALRRHRPGAMDGEEYLRFLTSLSPLSMESLRARRGPRGDQPFEL